MSLIDTLIFNPADDANLCALFHGYECDVNAECLSEDNQVNDSASYQCVCNEGYIGDGNTTCLGYTITLTKVICICMSLSVIMSNTSIVTP